MFVRFRQIDYRLQVSLIETRRVSGKVKHEHIASFGSVETPLSVEGRMAFWQRLHERLAKLSNRVDAAMQGKLLGDIHARILMVTLDEQKALQLENAKADERFWSGLHDMNAASADEHKSLAAKVERKVANYQAGMQNAAEARDTAAKRREKLERGEDVQGGLHKPEDPEQILLKAGCTKAEIRHFKIMGALADMGEQAWQRYEKVLWQQDDKIERSRDRAVKATARKVITEIITEMDEKAERDS